VTLTAVRARGAAGELGGVIREGTDPALAPLLFLHPINLQGRCWLDVVEAFGPERTCLMPDLRGHGGATTSGPFGIEEWVDDAVAVLDHLEVERAHVIGGSLGGGMAVVLAAREPDRVLSAMSFGGTLNVEGADLDAVPNMIRELGVRGMFEAVLPEISVAPGTPQAVIDRLLELANHNEPATVIELWHGALSTDARAAAAAVRCPVMVVTGEEDKTCPPEQGREMADLLGVELTVLPGVGHMPMLERPGETARIIAAHIAAAERAGAAARH
jgi:3-oxoadipate enol-lactonase